MYSAFLTFTNHTPVFCLAPLRSSSPLSADMSVLGLLTAVQRYHNTDITHTGEDQKPVHTRVRSAAWDTLPASLTQPLPDITGTAVSSSISSGRITTARSDLIISLLLIGDFWERIYYYIKIMHLIKVFNTYKQKMYRGWLKIVLFPPFKGL